MSEACQNCKAHGAEWLRKEAGEGRRRTHVHYSSCRRNAPEMTSTWLGSGPNGDAWAGAHPWVPYGYWCFQYAPGEDSTAASIELGELKLEPKHC